MLDRHADTCRHRDGVTRQNPDSHNGQRAWTDTQTHADTGMESKNNIQTHTTDRTDRRRHTTVRHRNRVTRQHSDSYNRQTEDRRHREHEAKFQSGCALAFISLLNVLLVTQD